MSLGSFFDRLGDNIGNAPKESWFTLAQALSAAPGDRPLQGLAQGISGFGQAAEAVKRRKGLADAFAQSDMTPIQRQLLQAAPELAMPALAKSAFDKPDRQSGPFAGTGFDASAANILVEGQMRPELRSSPEYAIAYSNLTNPRVVIGPDGNQMLYTPPVPRGIAPPGQSVSQMAPQAAPQLRPSMPPGAPSAPQRPPIPYSEPAADPVASVNPPDTVTATPTGVTQIPGTGKAPIETQIKNQSFYIRQRASEETLNDPAALDKFLDPSNAIPRSVGMGFLQSGPAQAVDQAGDEWVNAVLRPDSGAAIPPAELATYRATYVPEWGDKSEKIAQKRAARVRAAEGIKAGLTPAQVVEAEQVIARNPNPTLDRKYPAPPPEAIRDLKMRRDKSAFDEVFGPGSADKYLGK